MASVARAVVVLAALGTASAGGCERAEGWFGEPRAEVEAARRREHRGADGLSFAYPGNWALREEIGERGDTELRTIALESRGEALLLVQVFRPALALDLDEHLALTLRALIAEQVAQGGGVVEVEAGAVTAFTRAWLAAPRSARRVALTVTSPVERTSSVIELHAAQLPGRTVLVFTTVPDAGRAAAAAGFDLVLDTLAVDAAM